MSKHLVVRFSIFHHLNVVRWRLLASSWGGDPRRMRAQPLLFLPRLPDDLVDP